MTPRILEVQHRLRALITARSFQFGDFTLSSGKKSTFYLDLKKTMFDAEGLALLSELTLARLLKRPLPDLIGGIEMGAVPLVCGVMQLALQRGFVLDGFFVRKNVKGHGTQQLVEGTPVAGKRTVILEDVMTTGASARRAVEAVLQAGGTVDYVLVVIDREDSVENQLTDLGIPFYSHHRASEFTG